MNKSIFFFICTATVIFHVNAQSNAKDIVGRWKFGKMQMPHSAGFDLNDLTTTYKKFFYKQKHEAYYDTITTNDSLYIQVLFEKAVNDISRMFIVFKDDKKYITNSYDKEGNLTEKTETGTYSLFKNQISTYRNGNKNNISRFKVFSLNKTNLIMASGLSSNSAIITCKKVPE